MGVCKYCGQPAGFLRNQHSECAERHKQRVEVKRQGCKRIAQEAGRAIANSADLNELDKKVQEIAASSYIADSEIRKHLAEGWGLAVDLFLEDGIIDESEEKRLAFFKHKFQLVAGELDEFGALTKTVKSLVLRDVLNGVIPKRVSNQGVPQINFQKGEQVVWTFENTEYLEDKTRKQYVGGSRGMSVRVMKGVYYRVGSFKGHTVEQTERVHVDTGLFAMTNKNVYFVGSSKSVRIPYSKIVSFEPFSNGLGVMRDTATAKSQLFVTGDGWFAYNLAVNLAQL